MISLSLYLSLSLSLSLSLYLCLCLCLSLSLSLSLFLSLSLIVQWLLEKLSTLQDKAIRTINFKQYDHSVDELYHTNGILKIKEYIDLLNCLFVKTVISNESLPVFSKYFDLITYTTIIEHGKQPITLAKFIT